MSTLYVVATPIGNLEDMSHRAIDVLKSVNNIIAEDTRHSAPLLQHFGIKTPVMALHEHNERERVDYVIQSMKDGKSFALISDAGTPLISDPGYLLVRECHKNNIKVVPIPGACAAIVALSVSGLPTDKFVFEGFLPSKSVGRVQRLETLKTETRTLIFYEAPHRILDTLSDIEAVFGAQREVTLGRELTKLFETVVAGSVAQLREFVTKDKNQQKGEMVLVVSGQKASAESQDELINILKLLLNELPLKKAVELAAKLTNHKKNAIYDLALTLK